MCIEFQQLTCQVVVIKGLAYLLTYFIAVVIAAVAWNQLSLLSHSRPWPWVCGLGLACFWPWLTGLGTSGLVNIPGLMSMPCEKFHQVETKTILKVL